MAAVATAAARRWLWMGTAVAAGLAGGCSLPVSRAAAPPAEVRGVWVVRTDLTSPAAVRRVVDTAKRAGLNTLLVQVRGRGDAFYRSSLEPRALALRAQPAEFDPLADTVRAARGAGLRVHAWLNAMYVWSDPAAPPDAQHLVNAHPEWLAVDSSGRRLGPGCATGVFLCPSHPDARAHLREVVRDVAGRYDLDGIHLDYIRYPNARTCCCDGCRGRFRAWLAAHGKSVATSSVVAAYPAEWQAWRRERITTLVGEIRADLRRARPGLLLSAAVIPWGSYPDDFRRSEAYTTCAQDWYGWIRAGLVDAVAPMTYQASITAFRGWVEGTRRDLPGFPIWYGIGAYLCSPESAAAKIALVRQADGAGWCLFSYGSMTRERDDESYLRTLSGRLGLAPL